MSRGRLPRMYTDLADWWPLLSDPADYEVEAEIFRNALLANAAGPIRTLLELGSGGGNNASHLKRSFEMTLVDRAPGMLDVSRALNPECEHREGDMRSVRLGRTFDAVFVHDAIVYMTTEAELRAAMETAFLHTRPGGLTLFVPDHTKETFTPQTGHGGHDGDGRAMRYLMWNFDPDPGDDTCLSHYAYLLREGQGPVRTEAETHEVGLFSRATWLRLLAEVGFGAEAIPYDGSSWDPPVTGEMFLGKRPAVRSARREG